MAPTADERRQMARILRDNHDFVIDSYGRFWSNGTLFGMSFVAWEEKTIRDGLSRLADFIEPAPTSSDTTATHTDVTATCDVSQSRRDTVACDREALLELADELDETAWRGKVSDGWTASVALTISRYTDRIRKLCGEEAQ